jgi:hypothetical protein
VGEGGGGELTKGRARTAVFLPLNFSIHKEEIFKSILTFPSGIIIIIHEKKYFMTNRPV